AALLAHDRALAGPDRLRQALRREVRMVREEAAAARAVAASPAVAESPPSPRPSTAKGPAVRSGQLPVACVLGNMNLVRALGASGIRCAAVARRNAPPAYSRFVDTR